MLTNNLNKHIALHILLFLFPKTKTIENSQIHPLQGCFISTVQIIVK